MKKLLPTLILAILSVQISCSSASTEETSTQTTRFNEQRLLRKSFEGDSTAILEFASWVKLNNTYHEYFYQTSVIANKYHHPAAYFLIFWSYIHPVPNDQLPWTEQLNLLDPKSRAACLYNLLKSYELGYSNAKYIAEEIYAKYTSIPTADSYLDSLKN